MHSEEVCMCAWGRERDREWDWERENEIEREWDWERDKVMAKGRLMNRWMKREIKSDWKTKETQNN